MPDHSFLPLRRLLQVSVPQDWFRLRVRQIGEGNPRGEHILYHARSARRSTSNLALDYALSFGPPVIMAEWLDEPHLSPRTAAFIQSQVARNREDAAARGVTYLFEPDREIVTRARFVVTDEVPTNAPPASATHLVDHNGLLPMRALGKEQYSAKFFRERAHRMFEQFWISVDRAPEPVAGPHAILERFVRDGLPGYAAMRNRSPRHVSGLSPALHFGHIAIRDVVSRILESDAPAEDIDAFLEEAVIRRELSFNMCFYNPAWNSLDALPDWARRTLDRHRGDRRKPRYSYPELLSAATHDEVWNLAQRQLLACGTIHGYLRMLWGKKIIEWSDTPEEAHAVMVRLHDEYALDGRDPNTHAGILWCFGKHDGPWAPERPIFGMIRWMSSEQTAKKVRLAEIEAVVRQAEANAGREAQTDGGRGESRNGGKG